MALETAPRTDKVHKKTFPTPVFGQSNNLVMNSAIWAFLCSSKVGPSHPTYHLIEIALLMQFLPDNMWLFLEWVSALRCNEDAVKILLKHNSVSSSEVAAPVELRYPL